MSWAEAERGGGATLVPEEGDPGGQGVQVGQVGDEGVPACLL